MADYTRQNTWANDAGGGTPIDADALNGMEDGIVGSLQKSGGTMTGDIVLAGDANASLEPATKQQMDAADTSVAGTAASATSTVASNLSSHEAATSVHSAASAATASRLVLRDSNSRAKVADPSAATDIANKQWVEGRNGLATYDRTADQSISDNTEVTWTAGTEISDTIGASISSGVVTVTNAGLYLIHAHIVWAGNAAGYRRAWILVNNTTITGDFGGVPGGTAQVSSEAILLTQLAASDNVRVNVRQNSGGSLAVAGTGSGSFSSVLSIARIA